MKKREIGLSESSELCTTKHGSDVFLRQVASKSFTSSAQNCKKMPQMYRRPAFFQSAPNSQKSHQPSPFPTMVSILQPAISRRQVILPRPYTPTYKSDYHILTTNNPPCNTSQNHISQITISLIANHQPFYHRPPTDTPIRHGVYRGAQYWDKPHRRYR